ncbi:PaaX family transcriptional regulator C-terminal domain-containing protein [Streptomyces sp. NPDC091259]|uniref:PaaX family transcriptional regulator C-terminal domain-containing protein n=1 Tax=Streptomyces sp. NPDC091259 TaxID=3365976 RepID=UPI003819B5FB
MAFHHLVHAGQALLPLADDLRPAGLARLLWPVPGIADRYHRLGRIARSRLARLTGPVAPAPAELLTVAVELAAELTRTMEPDPLLPPQLLPQPWPGAQAPGAHRPVLGSAARTGGRRGPPGALPPLRRHHPRGGGPGRAGMTDSRRVHLL